MLDPTTMGSDDNVGKTTRRWDKTTRSRKTRRLDTTTMTTDDR